MSGERDIDGAPGDVSDPAQIRMEFVLRMRERGVANLDVLRALETVPRENFVPRRYSDLAWRDLSLPIACGQVMPEPYVVARMMEALELSEDHEVLEIGAGSGYSTAILARLAGTVVSYERYRTLALEAQGRLAAAGIDNVALHCGDGLAADGVEGQFDRIVIHLSLQEIPQQFLSRLKPGGRIVAARPVQAGQEAGLYLVASAGDGSRDEKFVVRVRYPAPETGVAAAL